MTDQTAKKTLFEYVKDQETWFYWYHNPKRINSLNKDKENWKDVPFLTVKKDGVIHKHLNDFFEATLDEVRLKKANAFSRYALWISGNHTLAYFREAASKREVAADIDYDMQRDHAVHTLYNYILGWYIFDTSEKFQDKFKQYLINQQKTIYGNEYVTTHDFFTLTEKEHEFYENEAPDEFGKIGEKDESIALANEFGDVWSITSLLHDVGYIFEGTISSASPEVENVRVIRGAKVVHDYFNHYFWEHFRVDYRAAQNIANLLDVSVPDFKNSQSLASLGDRLCDIGGCENIRKKLMERDGFKALNNEAIKNQYGLNREAFSIWNMYYETYKKNSTTTMQTILKIVKEEYYDAMSKGSNQGFKNLNHGVCSGLIVLQALTFYHEFVWGFDLLNWEKFEYKQNKEKNHINCVSKQIYDDTQRQIIEQYVPIEMSIRDGLSPERWFNKVLWATASIAIHDVIQQKYYEKSCKKYSKNGYPKISLDDDPLAFLGVLVDVLQEWDRYTISGELAFSEKTELLQSTDVDIDIVDSKSDKINFYYPLKKGDDEKDFSKDIKEVLNRCLAEWDSLIGIGVILLCPYCGEPFLDKSRHKLLETSAQYEGKAKCECEYKIKIESGKVTVTR
ncbi:hypothetical protein [Methylobacter tundripaludum]|uniref:Uncharacterized protein n=1 Tax=Methylobacter tundripaludum (strain ATCC BAA-1195 / DSM 17260 / SV96) TaxID=697282 RepID=G3IWJ6_METTV|nr:hypothetical protein [Methylobacter tundripaludum]EGW21935.1 hypothetical protein Mettu_0728 [Methylobacter tundripaludum SV96]